MLYALFCYNNEAEVDAWPKEKDDAVMVSHKGNMGKLAARGKLGPVARLMSTSTATTIRGGREPLVIDGPFAETKEQLLGFYVVDCATLEEAIEVARGFVDERGSMEIRPVRFFERGGEIKL